MSSSALALTPVPDGTGTGAGATTGTAQPTAAVITHRVRTRLENRRPGNRGASRPGTGRGRPASPSPPPPMPPASVQRGARMTSPALAQVPVLVDNRPGPSAGTRTLDAELLDRATRDDYQQWLSTALAAGGCVRPIRLRGTARDIDPATGEIVRGLDTEDLPDKAIYIPCGDRRASVCPPCAETYRADTYQLIRAGLAGGKGVPGPSPPTHACSLPSPLPPSARSTPASPPTVAGSPAAGRRRKANYCPHGRRLSCGQRHKETDACLGRPAVPRLL